jgi:hypothetical protein
MRHRLRFAMLAQKSNYRNSAGSGVENGRGPGNSSESRLDKLVAYGNSIVSPSNRSLIRIDNWSAILGSFQLLHGRSIFSPLHR